MKEKILVLEDEIGIRSFVSINLKREGYEVIEAGCGQEAIDKIKNELDVSYVNLSEILEIPKSTIWDIMADKSKKEKS